MSGSFFFTFLALLKLITLGGIFQSTETIATVFATDIVSLAAAFRLLPTLLPHSLPTRPSVTAFQRIEENRELLVNIILAYTLATVAGAFTSYTIERFGGYKFVEKFVYEISVPSILSAETMTTSEMMKVSFTIWRAGALLD